ncbi:acyl carrier protein 3, mitochondrial isoform X1 [Cucumis sativus]|uniref:acyl carrier protein 3, mitochondrial isoform X1 n=1 Tax=Cucumis sativus TaxID=3659 RepID=UPI0005EC3811|nr:acyl carrier protein 3, mitochondrial isoform X1 [Cucumis sativus]
MTMKAPANMQSIRNSILKHMKIRGPNNTTKQLMKDENVIEKLTRCLCASTGRSSNEIADRVIGLVKKFDRIDACKVTETADFQKDLSLDSLDRVELVMAFEQEFSIDIPEEQADKLTCCADVARYITSQVEEKKEEKL